VWSFVAAATIEVQSALITLAQLFGLSVLFAPASNRWFAGWTDAADSEPVQPA